MAGWSLTDQKFLDRDDLALIEDGGFNDPLHRL